MLEDHELAERVKVIIEQRDRVFTLAGEMLATLLMPRNVECVSKELRDLATTAWMPQLLAAQNNVELTDREVELALAASGIDIEPAMERLHKLIAKHTAEVAAREADYNHPASKVARGENPMCPDCGLCFCVCHLPESKK